MSSTPGIELPTLMDLEKMVDERGFEPPGLLVANDVNSKLRRGAAIT
jgi:hypothetical protein